MHRLGVSYPATALIVRVWFGFRFILVKLGKQACGGEQFIHAFASSGEQVFRNPLLFFFFFAWGGDPFLPTPSPLWNRRREEFAEEEELPWLFVFQRSLAMIFLCQRRQLNIALGILLLYVFSKVFVVFCEADGGGAAVCSRRALLAILIEVGNSACEGL